MHLYSDPCFLQHDTGAHPEQPERLRYLAEHLEETGLAARCRQGPITPVSLTRLARVHTPEYAERVRRFASEHGGYIERDTVVSRDSYDVALRAAGAVCEAVGQVVRGPDRQALCLVRPPGHHALQDSAMGFCLFNNIAVGAALATAELALNRVLIVDWDVHHGNGTQAAFWEDAQINFFSIHRWPFYPGTGSDRETGSGKGLGTIRNLPIAFGTSRTDYLQRFRSQLQRFADQVRPELVLISAGFDAHRLDPVGSLGLETEDFIPLTEIVMQIADQHAGGKLVSVLEGGYHVRKLAACVAAHLTALLEAEHPAESPPLRKRP